MEDQTTRYMARPVGTIDRQSGQWPGGEVQHYQTQRTLPGPGRMPVSVHEPAGMRDYAAQERFLREIQRYPSR